MISPVEAARAKIERAKEHLRELDREIGAWKQSPNMFITKYDSQTREYVYALAPLPLRFSVIIGDIAHNLRSALDVLVSGFVKIHGGKVTDGTGFPTWRKLPKDIKKAWKRKVQGLPMGARTAVKLLQPYRMGEPAAGDHPLWFVHELNRLDKHQVLHVVYTSAMLFTIAYDGDPTQWTTSWWTQVFPFDPNAEVHRSREPVNMKDRFLVEIAFEKSGPGKGEAVIPRLQQTIDFIAQIVERLHPFVLLSHDRTGVPPSKG